MLRATALTLALLLALPALAQGSSGTGFAIAPGLLVTNHHVVEGCTSLAVVVPGQGPRTARLIADDPKADLALVYALGLPGSVAALRTTPARLGEQVYAFGFPLAGALASSGNFTSGLVSALRGLGDKAGELQFTAPVQPGNSGGALLDRSGLVIGVVQGKLDAIRAARITGDIPQNVNFAVAGDVLARFLESHQATAQREAPGAVLDTTVVAERAQGFTFQISCETAARTARPAPVPSQPDQSPRPTQPATPTAPVANAAADAERALGLSVDDIRTVQLWLTALGHDPGAADGVIGQATRRAIRSYQRSRGVAETGYLSGQILSALRQDGSPAVMRAIAGHRFRDCPDCPEMVIVPPGSFLMGAAPGEEEAEGMPSQFRGWSSPQVQVRIGAPFAVGRMEVTRGEFAAFVRETGHVTGSSCRVLDGSKRDWAERSGANWRAPGFSQDDRHPAVCVSWDDAQAYVRWLSSKTGKSYRLLTEAEWEYAARAGSQARRPWGDSAEAGCGHANIADASTRRQVSGVTWGTQCDDGHGYTSPVGSYRANGFGLHDMIGNVWEWTADCWNENLSGLPTDGSARTSGDCTRRVLRGGSWSFGPRSARSADRDRNSAVNRNDGGGFRVARTL